MSQTIRPPHHKPARGDGNKTAVETGLKTINLALQGGGAHGAFTWGVLDRLLEEESIAFEGISATSAGSANAAVLAYGMTVGGRAGARQMLREFWRRVSRGALFNPLQPSLCPTHLGLDLLSRMFSPYQLNPLNFDPLRNALEAVLDFERLRGGSAVKLFLAATNVRTGKMRVFKDNEMSADVVLASACLPLLHQAVEIDGEHYWDGGYMGNPAIFPLIYGCQAKDVVIVHVNPITRPDVPVTAQEIVNRINEISFNSSLMREMRVIAFVTKLIETGRLQEHDSKLMRIHAIGAEDVMQGLGAASKLNPDWEFLLNLYEIGRKRTSQWLAHEFSQVGRSSTVDIERYL
jgi:NTE family protein